MIKKTGQFNIRVYSLIINDNNEVLLSDEFRLNQQMTKFPGGGLKVGEGTLDCIHREALEEFEQDVEIIKHFYTTDFFQEAFFMDNVQLISIYYLVKFKEAIKFKISSKKFDLPGIIDENQSFRWQPIASMTTDDLSFPIDKHVAKLLCQSYT